MEDVIETVEEPKGKEAPATEVAVTPEDVSLESVAREMGWKDKTEFTDKSGKPWVSAREFVLREREFSNRLRDKLESTESAVKGIKDHFDRQLEVERKRMREELDTARDEAIKEGDVDEVKRIDQELKDVDSESENDAKEGTEEARLLEDWKEEHKWYDTDVELTKKADAYARKFKKQGMEFPDILEAVSNVMQSLIAKPETRKPSVPAVEGDSRNLNTAKRHTVRDLTDNQRAILKVYRQEFPNSKDEDYIKQLEEQGVLS